MNNKVFLCKIVLLIAVQMSLFGLIASAETTGIDLPLQMDTTITDLSIDPVPLFSGAPIAEGSQYQLYAMADESDLGHEYSTVPQGGEDGLEKWHKYLGYGTVVMAGITAISSSDEDLHESVAYATAAGALSTLLTGYLAHGDRFDLEEGFFSKDNLHITMGTIGAALLTTAVVLANNGSESSHSGLGVTGGVLMTFAVIDIKW